MYELKKMERYLRVNLLGPGPLLMKKEFTRPRSHKGWETLLLQVKVTACLLPMSDGLQSFGSFTWSEGNGHWNVGDAAVLPSISAICRDCEQQFEPQTSPPHREIYPSIVLLFSQSIQLPSSGSVAILDVEFSCSSGKKQSTGSIQALKCNFCQCLEAECFLWS